MHLLYILFLYAVQPLVLLRLLFCSFANPEYLMRLSERYGFAVPAAESGGILIHCASLGEVRAALPLIFALRQQHPNLPITVTTITPAGSWQARTSLRGDICHSYLPYDLPGAVRRFLEHLSPRLIILLETELWPNLIGEAAHRGIPVVLASARLSEKSASGYRKIGSITRTMLQQLTLVAAQHKADGARFLALGLPEEKLVITGNLKFDLPMPEEMFTKAAHLRRDVFCQRPVWIAASTHPEEEKLIIDAHERLLSKFPNLLLILAPRHSKRVAVVLQLAQQRGIRVVTRSSGQNPATDTQILLVDTIGELMFLYGVADIAFVGGSMAPIGGHNPLEPAAHALPIIVGIYDFNFKEIDDQLLRAGALTRVANLDALVAEIADLLTNKEKGRSRGAAAREILMQSRGVLNKLLEQLSPYLP